MQLVPKIHWTLLKKSDGNCKGRGPENDCFFLGEYEAKIEFSEPKKPFCGGGKGVYRYISWNNTIIAFCTVTVESRCLLRQVNTSLWVVPL